MSTPGQGLEILTQGQMAQADAAAVEAGHSVQTLMERAGEAVAATALGLLAKGRITVLCGPGANGGDGYVAARRLAEHGLSVTVEALAPAATPDARAVAQRWTGPMAAFGESATTADLVIDALFGSGLNRPLAPEAARLARTLERADANVLAVDTPSGVSGDTAQVIGGVSFRARNTVTFHRRKLAHVLQPGRGLCGETLVADIGLGLSHANLFENRPALWLDRQPKLDPNAHKHSRGSLIVVSGEAWSTGRQAGGQGRPADRGGLGHPAFAARSLDRERRPSRGDHAAWLRDRDRARVGRL